jgi:hypothetical protein
MIPVYTACQTAPLTPAQAAVKVRQGLCDWCAYEPDEAVVSVLRELIRALDPNSRQITTADRSVAP